VSKTAVTLSLLIDVLATYIPFQLLRPLSLAHAASGTTRSPKGSVAVVPNEDIVNSASIQALTTTLASLIYATTLYGAYRTYLPVYLVTYFDAIPTIAAAHDASPLTLFPTTLLLGLACKSFIFTPAAASAPSRADARLRAFDPVTATLGETVWYNFCGFQSRTKMVMWRTVSLMLVSGGNTFLQTWMTVQGVEVTGAVAYSAVWVAAAAITGVALGVVGAV
jgi:hypothetical protein